MKKLKYLCLAFLVASLLAIPAAAQGRKGTRNNNSVNGAPEPRGQARAEEVQTENGKGDKDHTPSKGSKRKSQGKKTREGWEKNSQHGGRKK